ncbi:MAG TPA: hypothetical protein VF898_03715 [Chloroflexota bacterium]
MRRSLLLVFFCIVLSAWPASIALAHGPVRKGLELDHNTTLNLQTGAQHGEWHWVTVGLVPGTVHVTVTLKNCGNSIAPSCGLYAFLYRQHQIVAHDVTACYARGGCNRTLRLTYRVHVQDVYYVLIAGAGADGIPYRLSVAGSIIPLHCRTYC